MNYRKICLGVLLSISVSAVCVEVICMVAQPNQITETRIEVLQEEVDKLYQKNLQLKSENCKLKSELEEINETVSIYDEEGLVVYILPEPELITRN